MFTLIIAPLLENVTPSGALNRSNTVDLFYPFMNKYTFTFCVLLSLHLLATILNLTLLLTPSLWIMKICLYYASSHKMGRHIVFSSVVCPSVYLSVKRLCLLISFEPLVEFTNNSAQISSMMSRWAVRMFKVCFRFKVKHCMTWALYQVQ